MKTTPKDIAKSAADGLRRVLNLTESNCRAAIQRYAVAQTQLQYPYILVIPGSDVPDGSGSGAQEGGDLFRRMSLTFVCYTKSNLDQAGQSEIAMLRDGGILDLTESVLGVFRDTFLAQIPYSLLNGLLIEPMFYTGSSDVYWEDEKQGILRREIGFSCQFETSLTQISLITAQGQ